MDSSVTLADAQLAQSYYSGTTNLTELQKYLADYNGDGNINLTDVQLIQQKALNII